jgi:tryptophan-rich sensory protein
VFAAAAIGAIASADAAGFYDSLMKPLWAPPAWLFAPVWSVLYVLMAIAAWLVGKARGPLGLFLLQLALNALWTWLFFAWKQGAWAFAGIVVLWLLIAATAASFWRVRPLAGALLLPYLAWVTYAAALSFVVWQLNPRLLG